MAKHLSLKELGITGIQPLTTLDGNGPSLDMNKDFGLPGIKDAAPMPTAKFSPLDPTLT
ncbi:MAG: hypothetical protein H6853_02540 [Rhodospirillales bacterium]|nr:hypothetical protein [Alphaproteobacteria bacterium]USO04168.1 MAG: hypothetical protein H6853_02540 [Rhodospirillales bacterium]